VRLIAVTLAVWSTVPAPALALGLDEREQDQSPPLPGAGAAFQYDVMIGGVGDEDLTDLLLASSQLMALRARPPDTLAGLQRRVEEDLERLRATLRSEGFYAAKIDYSIEDETRPIAVRLAVATGPRYHLGHYEISYRGETLPEQAEQPSPEDLGLETGMPARAKAIRDSQSQLLRALAEGGYPFAEIVDRKAVVDHAINSMTVTVEVDSGPQARFGTVSIEGLEGVKDDYVLRFLSWTEGDLYDVAKLDATRASLTRTGLFSAVVLRPADALDDAGALPITLEFTESAHRSFGFGVSYSTDIGASGEAFWEHRNLFGRSEQLQIAGTAARIERSAEARFRKPDFWRRTQALLANATITKRDTDAFDERSVTTYLGIEMPFGEHWLTTAGASAGYDDLKDEGGEEELLLLGLPLTAERNASNSRLNPTRGTRLDLSLTPYSGTGDSNPLFLTILAGSSAYLSVDAKSLFVLAGRARVGSIVGEPTDELPANKRFYAGGGGSIRGYEFQTVGPLDANDDPLGGRSLLEVGAELRIRATERLGVVPFVDGGTVYDSSVPSFDETFRWAAGLGMRYFTGIGPVRLDVALPLNKRDGVDDDFQFYVSFGQAF
jgi:translocation and assembly module TamA